MKFYFIISFIVFIISIGMLLCGIFFRKKINELLTALFIVFGLLLCFLSFICMMCFAFFLV